MVEPDVDQNCIFCKIINEKKEPLLRINDELAAFHDIKKGGAVEHVLVISRKHIRNVNSLTRKDENLVLNMKKLGEEILSELRPNKKTSDFRLFQ